MKINTLPCYLHEGVLIIIHKEQIQYWRQFWILNSHKPSPRCEPGTPNTIQNVHSLYIPRLCRVVISVKSYLSLNEGKCTFQKLWVRLGKREYWERIKGLILRHFGKLNSSFYGKLRLRSVPTAAATVVETPQKMSFLSLSLSLYF